ncbi:MAG: peptide chain release factor N(5)-glutamine methyltransferase [Pricia sp.]|nr:peptide chain release factor N(5)-glutamine methyltransferase [Pricia sp.]
MLLKEIKNIFHKELDEIYPKEEVDTFFYRLVEHYLNLERFVLAFEPNLTLSKEEEQPMFEALSRLRDKRPLQYIIGSSHFMDMDFKVDENVLIPRPETEELVRWILADRDSFKLQNRSIRILDIGTGSGCIAVSLAKNIPEAQVLGIDISDNALNVARQNAFSNDVKVDFTKVDILGNYGFDVLFDVIVSNPPYVRELEKTNMQKNVTAYEPDSALFVPNENPLLFYRAIAHIAKKHLVTNGLLFLEINQYLAKETEALLRQHNFSEIELRKDMFGNHRFIRCSNHSKKD